MATPTATIRQSWGTVDYTPGTDVTAGDVVAQGELVGVAHEGISANVLGALTVAGVIRFPKATTSGSALTAGANVYWNTASEVAQTTQSTYKLIGKVVTAAGASQSWVDVLMNQ